jgi:hypothetical protein
MSYHPAIRSKGTFSYLHFVRLRVPNPFLELGNIVVGHRFDNLEDTIRIFGFVSQPEEIYSATTLDLAHGADLLTALLGVALIDAYGIYPEHPSFVRSTEVTQGYLQAWGNAECLLVKQYVSGKVWFAPEVRYCFVCLVAGLEGGVNDATFRGIREGC